MAMIRVVNVILICVINKGIGANEPWLNSYNRRESSGYSRKNYHSNGPPSVSLYATTNLAKSNIFNVENDLGDTNLNEQRNKWKPGVTITHNVQSSTVPIIRIRLSNVAKPDQSYLLNSISNVPSSANMMKRKPILENRLIKYNSGDDDYDDDDDNGVNNARRYDTRYYDQKGNPLYRGIEKNFHVPSRYSKTQRKYANQLTERLGTDLYVFEKPPKNYQHDVSNADKTISIKNSGKRQHYEFLNDKMFTRKYLQSSKTVVADTVTKSTQQSSKMKDEQNKKRNIDEILNSHIEDVPQQKKNDSKLDEDSRYLLNSRRIHNHNIQTDHLYHSLNDDNQHGFQPITGTIRNNDIGSLKPNSPNQIFISSTHYNQINRLQNGNTISSAHIEEPFDDKTVQFLARPLIIRNWTNNTSTRVPIEKEWTRETNNLDIDFTKIKSNERSASKLPRSITSSTQPIIIVKGKLIENKFNGKSTTPADTMTNLTAEYYQNLYDSFGGNDALFQDFKSSSNIKKNLASHANAFNHADSISSHYFAEPSVAIKIQDNLVSSEQQIPTLLLINRTDQHQQSTNKLDDNNTSGYIEDESDGLLNAFFNITKLEIRKLIPRPLQTNLHLIKQLFIECYSNFENKQNIDGTSLSCLKKITLKVLDKVMKSDIVRITDTVSLIRENRTALTVESSSPRLVSSNVLRDNWLGQLTEKLMTLFTTHSLKIRLLNSDDTNFNQIEEGRRRHHFRRVFPIIASIYLTFTAVLIPLVFQFMAMMGGKSFIFSKLALIVAVITSLSKFLSGVSLPSTYHHHFLPPPPPAAPYPSPVINYEHQPQVLRRSDKNIKRRRRHYRRLFPIMVAAYMILSTVLIPLGFKFMTLLGAKSLLVSKISLIIALMGGFKKYFGMGNDNSGPQSHIYPSMYPPFYPPYYDPWRRDEYRKISHGYDYPTEFAHYTEEIE